MTDRFVSIKETTRSLPCRLTDAEMLTKADELSVVVQEIGAEEDRQADVKAQMKAKLTELDARKTRLAIVIGRREEYREVRIQFMADVQAGTVSAIRIDTGEVLETRPMTDDERQRALPLEVA